MKYILQYIVKLIKTTTHTGYARYLKPGGGEYIEQCCLHFRHVWQIVLTA